MSWNTGRRMDPSPTKNFENQENDPSNIDTRSIVHPAIDQSRRLPSLYHGTWPMDRDLWNGNTESSKLLSSVMSFSSNTSQDHHHHLKQENNDEKSDVTSSLFKMLLADATGREDITKLFKLSNITENCLTMRKSGCLSLLVQLIHAPDQNPTVRHGASLTLFNIVRANQIQPQARQELHVLELVEQLRDYSQYLRGYSDKCKEPHRHPLTAMSLLTKLSFSAAHRHIMCEIGGLQAIAEIIVLDHLVHGSNTTDPNCLSLRRCAGVSLANLTFGDSKNKCILCSYGKFIKVWISQFNSDSEDLHQVTASVLRNLSLRADVVSKRILREMNTVTYLTNAAMKTRREQTLKLILSALWNLSAHCTKNKIDICVVKGALEFLVDMISLKSPTKLAIVENGGGILRNVSSHVAVEEKYRVILRKKNSIVILVKLLKSPSNTVVSNSCGTLWNLSARCPEDQKTLWNLGVVPLLRELANSKHKMIAMGASAALRNLLTARNCQSQIFRPIDSGQIVKRSVKVPDNCGDSLSSSRIIAGCRSRSIVEGEDEREERSPSNRSWTSSSPKRPSSPQVDSETRNTEESSKTTLIKLEDNLNEDADYDKNHYPEMRKGSPVGSPYFERRRRNNSGPYEADGDEPVDYSQKFIEKNQTKTKQSINNKIKTESDDEDYTNENGNNIFGDYAETDLDQPTDYSLRYAEDDTDDEEKQSTRYFTVNEQEDTIKTYCTEGTPYETPFNFSNATSMSDLRLEEIKEGETSKKLIKKQVVNGRIKDFKQEKNFIEKKEIDESEEIDLNNKNDERLEVNNCQEKTVYYYEEGTPGRISPVNSLSSLGSLIDNRNDEVIVEAPNNQSPKENKPKESPELPPPLDLSVGKTPQKQNDKEAKMVTFGGEDHYAEETPLMFSRSSSLGSLSGFEQMLIHDDRSSIISDFSRRTSGVVSPSELPDSPTQTVPPSPRHQKNPIDYSLRNPPSQRFIPPTFTKFPSPTIQKTKPSFFEDDTATFKEESTPIEFSAATSLSSLTIDDDIKSPEISLIEGKFFDICKIKTEDNVQLAKNLPAGFLKIKEEEEEEEETPVKTERENYGQYREQDQISDVDEEDDEDMLAACINMGMQNNRYRQNLQKTDNKPQAYPTLVSNLIRYQTSSTLDRLESSVFEPRSGSSPLKTKLNIDASTEVDTMHVYCTEDTPADISPVGSQSNLSALSLPSIIEDFEKPDEAVNLGESSTDSSIISGEDGDKILDECIQSGMPKRVSPGLLINPGESELALTRLNSVEEEEEEEEGDCCEEGLPSGQNEEGFNNSFDDSPNQSDDEAILAECIESGMPKARINISPSKNNTHSRSLSRSMEKIKGDFVNVRGEERKSSGSEDSLSLSDDEEEDDLILAQCIRSGMPKASTSNFSQTLKEDTRRILNVSLSPPPPAPPPPPPARQINLPKSLSPTAAQDEIAGFETEDTPCNFSVVSEFSSLSINSNLD